MCVGIAEELQLTVVLLNAYSLRHRNFQCPLGALHFQCIADLDLHSGRNRDQLFAYSGHEFVLIPFVFACPVTSVITKAEPPLLILVMDRPGPQPMVTTKPCKESRR